VVDEAVCRFFLALRELARGRLAEVDQLVQRLLDDGLEPMSREELVARMAEGAVVLLDVRPVEEFAAGHIPGAVSVPLGLLDDLLDTLPPDTEVVAYCRGPYCLLAPQALEILRAHGLRARRLTDGFPEWRLAGLPIAVGAEER
jgi:rhodanese-related sulfurtransferase